MARRIDVHHHIIPPHLAAGTSLPMDVPDTDTQLRNMDGSGIDVAMLSITPRLLDANPGHIRAIVRGCNDYQAELLRDHGSRFGSFAALPLPDVDASLEEIGHALDVLRLDGIGLFSNQDGRYLGDPILDEVFAELNRRKSVVFVHPAHCEPPEGSHLNAPGAIVEYVFDTTRAIVNLLFNGTFRKFPDVRFIFSHGGGAAPFIQTRIMSMDANPSAAVDDTAAALRALYYDIASAVTPGTLSCLRELVGARHLLFGSDMPFVYGKRLAEEIEHWEEYEGFDAAERAAIDRDNAVRLFPRFA